MRISNLENLHHGLPTTSSLMSVHSFIAHYLKENGYPETLKSFEKEHGSAISTELPHDEALTDIITDRMKYLTTKEVPASLHDHWLDKELAQIKSSQFKEWSAPYPQSFKELPGLKDLVIDAAIFHFEDTPYLICGTSGKSLVVFDLVTRKQVIELKEVIGKVVIRRIVVSSNRVLLCGMNGKVYVGKFSNDMSNFEIVREEQIHTRLVTDVKVIKWQGAEYLVSMGWDFLVKVFRISEDNLTQLGEPFKLANQGTCLDAGVYKEKLYILVGKSEITLMDVLCLNSSNQLELDCRIALNDAEFSASGFTPMSIKTRFGSENDVPLVAVGTSHEPFMRVVIVSLKDVGGGDSDIKRSQIIANINTMSPQDKYSQASIFWRFDGSGLWILGEDGTIRGLDLSLEQVALELKQHDGRIKSCAIYKDSLVSCGTDRRILEWTY